MSVIAVGAALVALAVVCGVLVVGWVAMSIGRAVDHVRWYRRRPGARRAQAVYQAWEQR